MAVRQPLSLFLEPAPRHDRARTLSHLIGLSLLVSTGLGLLLLTVEAPVALVRARHVATRITFHAPAMPTPPTPPAPSAEPEPEALDLTAPAVLAQAVDLPAPAPELRPEAGPAVAEPAAQPAPRRVYGVRKVLARGLGSGARRGSRRSGGQARQRPRRRG